MNKDENKNKVVNLSELVKEMLEAPFNGGRIPPSQMEKIEMQQLFAHDLFSEILNKVSDGVSVKVKNVGNFSLRMTRPTARNPSKNEIVEVKERKRLRFTASSSSVKKLNK